MADGSTGPVPAFFGVDDAYRAALEIMRAASGAGVQEGYRIMRDEGMAAHRRMLSPEDAREGIRAFGERRPPRRTGR